MASAENSVNIKVSFSGQEQVLPLSIRPSLELSDYKVDTAEDLLDQALRRAFSIQPDATFYLHEAETGRIMSKESFRDPGYCSDFPRHWNLIVEQRSNAKTTGNSGKKPNVTSCGINLSTVEDVANMFGLGEVEGGVELGDNKDTGSKVSYVGWQCGC